MQKRETYKNIHKYNFSKDSEPLALVLGGYINGYSIIKELHEQNIKKIALIDTHKSIAWFSNKVIYKKQIKCKSYILCEEIKKLNIFSSKIIIYPTDDLYLELLNQIYEEIKDYCYLPFNNKNILETLDKFYQYKICKQFDIPCPDFQNVLKVKDLSLVNKLKFPILVKPTKRKDLVTKVFRNLYLDNYQAFEKNLVIIKKFISQGIGFIFTEFIPGDDTNIYAYTCFRSNEGEILNFWTGKKLNQYPNVYGVFSSASNSAPKIIEKHGFKLVQALKGYGIIQPEFKFDFRDGKYKLMEVNMRPMMWHRTGCISGVKLMETQYFYGSNKPTKKYIQNKKDIVHFIFMIHEISNLIARKGYFKFFKKNLFGQEKLYWAIYDEKDIKPFLFGLIISIKSYLKACLNLLDIN